jgi:hypothetical protein
MRCLLFYTVRFEIDNIKKRSLTQEEDKDGVNIKGGLANRRGFLNRCIDQFGLDVDSNRFTNYLTGLPTKDTVKDDPLAKRCISETARIVLSIVCPEIGHLWMGTI